MTELCATPEEVWLQEAEILPNHFAAKALIGVEVIDLTDSTLTEGQVVLQLLMYLTLPQLLAIALYGFIMIILTRMNIAGLNHHIESMELSRSLSNELARISADDAFSIIQSGRGTQFDPHLVDHFVAVRNEVEDIYYN